MYEIEEIEIEQMILQVFTRNNKLYLEGYALNEVAGSAYVLGSKNQFYEVTEEQLETWSNINLNMGTFLLKEYMSLPNDADIYEPPLLNTYITGDSKENKIIRQILKIGFEEYLKILIDKNPTIDKTKISTDIESTYFNTLINLTNDYITKKGISSEEALEKAAIDLKCNNPRLLIKATKKITEPAKTKTQYPYLSAPYLRDPYLSDPYLRDPDLSDSELHRLDQILDRKLNKTQYLHLSDSDLRRIDQILNEVDNPNRKH